MQTLGEMVSQVQQFCPDWFWKILCLRFEFVPPAAGDGYGCFIFTAVFS